MRHDYDSKPSFAGSIPTCKDAFILEAFSYVNRISLNSKILLILEGLGDTFYINQYSAESETLHSGVMVMYRGA